MSVEIPAEGGVVAERLTHLFSTVHPAGRKPYSTTEVAKAINEKAGEQILSPTYLWQLKTGKRTDPTHSRLKALADFFGVPVAYFYEDDTARRTDEQLELAAALTNPLVRQLALTANGLSDNSLHAILTMIQSARRIEGLNPADDDGE
ncbi:helix-turn-helix domain-containing protein [Kitasatospora sp. NPDC093550]|uniref:helix-turn-helix domain-containing protein n=1 Tax=Kitasatospora sp. NPDC093550 TaxID=3364089 RepID=UPI00381E406C